MALEAIHHLDPGFHELAVSFLPSLGIRCPDDNYFCITHFGSDRPCRHIARSAIRRPSTEYLAGAKCKCRGLAEISEPELAGVAGGAGRSGGCWPADRDSGPVFGGRKGPGRTPFNDVRIALQAQIQHLSQTISQDLADEILQARGSYAQISIDQMQQRRDKAVAELRRLKKLYKRHLYSRARAEVYYDLKLDELIAFLEQIRFELPPDISVGKLNDRLLALKKKMDDLELQRDQLPEIEEIPSDQPQADELSEDEVRQQRTTLNQELNH